MGLVSRRLGMVALLGGLAAGGVAEASLRGMWVSPDWLFFGDRPRSEEEARTRVRQVLEIARRAGTNALFVESLNRGQSLGPGQSGRLPVYPLVRWDFRTSPQKTYDLLQVFIDEARARDIDVHAWVHVCYFRSDSETFRRPWQDGPTIFDPMLAEDLEGAARVARSLPRRRAAQALALLLRQGFDRTAFDAILARWGVASSEGKLNGLVRWLMAADASPPECLLTTPSGDVHYGFEQDRILAIYVNPADPRIRQAIAGAVKDLAAGHPGLAGIHLDHVRYPRSPLGPYGSLPPDPRSLDRSAFEDLTAVREQALAALVGEIRAGLPPGLKISAAVMPDYYSCRAGGARNFCAWVSQDWASWGLDLAIPLAYGRRAADVHAVVAEARRAAARRGARTEVLPGVSTPGFLSSRDGGRPCVFFDMRGLRDQIDDIPGSALLVMGLGDRLF